MAQYKDTIPESNPNSTSNALKTDLTDTLDRGWIHELARCEVHPEAEKILNLGRSFDPEQLVEESAIQYLNFLREAFSEYARVFNSYSNKGEKFAEIKIYSVAQSAADFLLFRNQVKLVISNSAHGAIQLSFASHRAGSLAVDGMQSAAHRTSGTQTSAAANAPKPQEILAQVGPFRDVYWTFQGEKVSPKQVAKYYFAEFIRMTRDQKRSKLGNQVLLDQIKALLQEKGLDL